MKHILLSLLLLSLSACKTITPEEKRAFWQEKLNGTPGKVLVMGRMNALRSSLFHSTTPSETRCENVVLEAAGGGAAASAESIEDYMYQDNVWIGERPFAMEVTPGYYNVKIACDDNYADTGYAVAVKRDAKFIYIGDFRSIISDPLFGNTGGNVAANLGMMALGASSNMRLSTETTVTNNAEAAATAFDKATGVMDMPPLEHAIAYPAR